MAHAASDVLILADQTPIASGTNREVWARPGHPDQILKTVRAHKLAKYKGRGPLRRIIDDYRHGPFGAFRCEYRCYLRTAYRCYQTGRPLPIAEIGGLVLTDRGLAQVCEKITDDAGNLAQSIHTMLKEQSLSPAQVRLLNDFVTDMFYLNVNVPDLTSANVLFDGKRERFILVDGYGDRTLIPLLAWFRPLNQKEMRMRFAKMAVPGYLDWLPEDQQFKLV